MSMGRINVVIGREYLNKVKKKSFLWITFLVPVLFVVVCSIPSLIMFLAKEPHTNVAVVDESSLVLPLLEDSEVVTYIDMSQSGLEEIKGKMDELGLDVVLHVGPVNETERNFPVTTYSLKPIGMDLSLSIKSYAEEAIEDYRIARYGIDSLKEIMDDVRADVHVDTYTLDASGEATISVSEIYMIISMVLGMIIYVFIALFSGMVMSSVTEEKTSRVAEVLVASVKSTELMYGKIIGVALVALTQFVLWILLAVILLIVLVVILGAVAGPSVDIGALMAGANDMVTMADTSSLEAILGDGLGENSNLGAVISTLASIRLGGLLVSFLVYFALGYLLYAALFAAVGAAADNEADTNQLSLPLTAPLMLGFFVSLYASKAPDSALVFWFSIIPFTSPIVMLARIPYGVPLWEIALSLALIAGTFILCAWASAKVYRAGLLQFGRKPGWKDLWKWLRMD